MIFLIDIGNTNIKWGQLDHKTVELLGSCFYKNHLSEDTLFNDWQRLASPQKILISNVAAPSVGTQIHALVKKLWNLDPIFIQENQSIENIRPIKTQNILGIDRWLALLSLHQTVKNPFALVGCGTAITIDIVQNGVHLGGLIAPNVELMRLALIEHTAGCRLNPNSNDSRQLLAFDTDGAMRAGTLYMAANFIENMLEKIEKELNVPLKRFITGGDAERLTLLFQIPAQFTQMPSLVLDGLALFA